MPDLDKLKNMIDEENYPYYDDGYLLAKLDEIGVDYGVSMESLLGSCINKAGIEKWLGDIIMPSPKIASSYARALRTNKLAAVREDERQ